MPRPKPIPGQTYLDNPYHPDFSPSMPTAPTAPTAPGPPLGQWTYLDRPYEPSWRPPMQQLPKAEGDQSNLTGSTQTPSPFSQESKKPSETFPGTFQDMEERIKKVEKIMGKGGTQAIAVSGGGGGTVLTIQDEGTSLTQRSTLNFIGANVTAADDADNTRTNVTISGGTIPTLPVGGVTLPVNGDFSWVNQGDATVTALADSRIHLTGLNSAGFSVRARVKATPATPWTLDAGFQWVTRPAVGNDRHAGLVLRESSTGKLITFAIAAGSLLLVQWWNSPTSFNATKLTSGWSTHTFVPIFMRIVRSGGNLQFLWAPDGEGFLQQYAEADTAFLAGGPDQYGFFVLCDDHDVLMNLFHWEQS